MKIKTSTRISIIFSIFTFFIIFAMLILLNVLTFLGWYEEERNEIINEVDFEYSEILDKFINKNIQKDEFIEDLIELGGFFHSSNEILNYNNIYLDLYSKNNLFFLIYEKETIFGNIFIPYDITTHFHNQTRQIGIGLLLLFIFTGISFFISQILFIKFALKDIFYISNKLKNIELININKIELDLNKKDEINIIVESINNFLIIIEQNTKSLKKFNAEVSHEFKTPLMVISSELEYLSLSGNNNDSYKKIERQIDILNELLETFLFISKIENFKGNIKNDTVNITECILMQLENLNKIYSDKNIKIINKTTRKIKIKTNKQLLEVLLKNILDNAFKYNKKGGDLIIDLNNNYLIIKDNGIGITKENLSKIFDSFYRIGNETKGYGVGLNIVKKIVNILGYKIEVKSEIGKGTEFKIVF